MASVFEVDPGREVTHLLKTISEKMLLQLAVDSILITRLHTRGSVTVLLVAVKFVLLQKPGPHHLT